MDIAPAAGEEAPIFAPAKRYPDPVFGHCSLSSAFLPRSGPSKYRCEDFALEPTFERSCNLMPQ
jgi:hypothetical protein